MSSRTVKGDSGKSRTFVKILYSGVRSLYGFDGATGSVSDLTMASKVGKILVVDDNLGIRRALEILLPLHFAEVKTIPSPSTLVSSLEQFRPDVVLCVGQAAGRSAVTPERVAINVDDARIPDNNGCQPVDAPIVPGGPAAYFATVPVKDMVRAIREAGVPSELSNSAGTYVCNHLLYCVLHHAGPGVRAGFIHVPCIPEQTEGTDRPSLPLAQLVTALEAAVSACCKG